MLHYETTEMSWYSTQGILLLVMSWELSSPKIYSHTEAATLDRESQIYTNFLCVVSHLKKIPMEENLLLH